MAFLVFYLKTVSDSEHVNETVEAIETLIVSAIEQLKKSVKGSDEQDILDYIQKKENNINQQALSVSIASLSKNSMVLNKLSIKWQKFL